MNPYPALGDFTGDGTGDLAVGGQSGRIRLISSPGHFNNPQSPAVNYDLVVPDSATALPAFCDITGNGTNDLLVLLTDGSVRTYPHTGNALLPYDADVFTNSLLETGVPGGSGISSMDINADGIADILVSDQDGRIWEFHGSIAGVFELKSKVWGGAGKGMASNMAIGLADVDGDEDVDVICGFAEGGLMYLRDPRIGSPDNLAVKEGARSLQLTWNPNESFRIKGYHLYRDTTPAGDFTQLTDPKLIFPEYLDEEVVPGEAYFYYVTAVSQLMLPGSSIPRETESKPSDIASGRVGQVTLTMPDYAGMAGTTTVSSVSIGNARDIAGDGLEIRISYDPAVIRPVAQVVPAASTVERSVLAQAISLSDNGATASGELIIQGTGTGAIIGEGRVFDINWFVNSGIPNGTKTTNTFTWAVLKDTSGADLAVDITDYAVLTVQAAYIRGDANGDGVVNMDDFHLCMKMAIGQITPDANQLMACDLNDNGEVDKDDAHLILRLIHQLKANP